MATVGDLVLIYEEEKPAFFARIEDITADHKPEWYQVRLLVLHIPVAEAVWILREAYINGEVFTMGGRRIRLEKVVPPKDGAPETKSGRHGVDDTEKGKTRGNVISIFDRKRD